MTSDKIKMFNSELKNQIKSLRTMQGVGSPRSEWLKGNREVLLMQIKNTLAPVKIAAPSFQFVQVWNFLNVFMPRQAVSYVMKPAAVMILVISLVTGGWVTTVSASYDSLPGDAMYSVKLATENVQTTLASKPQETKLRAEFAGRRAEEVKKIVKSNLSKKDKKIKVEEAVTHLKKDLEQVKGNLDAMKNNASQQSGVSANQAVEVAKVVEQKTTEIQKSLEQTKEDLKVDVKTEPTPLTGTLSVQEQVKQATATTVETGVKAVEVMVEKHQADGATMPAQEVKDAVDSKLKALEVKVNQVETQINTIVTSTPAGVPTTRKEQQDAATLMAPAKQSAGVAKEALNQAKDELAKDNFNGAMDKLREGTALTQVAEVKADAAVILKAPMQEIATSTLPTVEIKSATSSVIIAPAVKPTSGTTSSIEIKK
ncbi:MAG: hypothetical protein HZC05_03560 [Candidatus Magasanikbacteria bacterium]|nr:hypothetical protein [Candidatus Magasanikbacteria bacterium]